MSVFEPSKKPQQFEIEKIRLYLNQLNIQYFVDC